MVYSVLDVASRYKHLNIPDKEDKRLRKDEKCGSGLKSRLKITRSYETIERSDTFHQIASEKQQDEIKSCEFDIDPDS